MCMRQVSDASMMEHKHHRLTACWGGQTHHMTETNMKYEYVLQLMRTPDMRIEHLSTCSTGLTCSCLPPHAAGEAASSDGKLLSMEQHACTPAAYFGRKCRQDLAEVI